MSRQANYFRVLYFHVCVQRASVVVYLTTSQSEAFVLRMVQQHKLQYKIKFSHKQEMCCFHF